MKKKILILGASSTIGLSLIKLLVKKNNYNLNLHYFKNYNFLKKYNKICNLIKLDFALSSISEIENKFDNNYDIIINLIGYIDNNTFKNFTIEKMHQSLKINSILPWIIIRMSMQHMKNQKWGKIINTSSIGVDYGGGINSFNYSISKYVNEFIPIEIKKHFKFNIFYNVLKIGITETKIHNKIYNKSLN